MTVLHDSLSARLGRKCARYLVCCWVYILPKEITFGDKRWRRSWKRSTVPFVAILEQMGLFKLINNHFRGNNYYEFHQIVIILELQSFVTLKKWGGKLVLAGTVLNTYYSLIKGRTFSYQDTIFNPFYTFIKIMYITESMGLTLVSRHSQYLYLKGLILH